MTSIRTAPLFLATLLAGCTSKLALHANDGAAPDTAAVDSAAVDTGETLAACVEDPPAQPGARAIVTVAVDLTYGGKPVVFGEPFALPGGGTLTVSNFRFYLSDVQVLAGGGQPINVDIVAPDGQPVHYNVHLVNAESAAEMTFRIAVPVGDYTGMSFLFGLSDACNLGVGSKPPLTAQSQMTWPPPFGFLFLRYEGAVTGAMGPDAPVAALAMAAFPRYVFAPRINADGALHVAGGGGDMVHLRVALDEIFRAAALPLDPSMTQLPVAPPPGREIEAGEHLRQNATKVPILSVTSGS